MNALVPALAPQLPRAIAAKPKAYAFERSLGIPPAEACRRAGGKVENGQATKWENNRRVQAWIAHYRSLGQDDEMIAAKRARIEERLALAAFGNIFITLRFSLCASGPVSETGLTGKVTVKVVPFPSIVSTVIVPA